MTVKIQMLPINSPKFSASGKGDIASKMSPYFRNKRVPSALESYSCQSNPVKQSKNQSPAKLSQEAIRRRSQLQNNPNSNNGGIKRSKQKNNQNIIDSIHELKNQYKILKEAYKQMIQQKMKNGEQMSSMKAQNQKLRSEHEKVNKDMEKLKMQICFLEQENERIKRQCYKMLEVERFKAKKLEQSLLQKEQYINQTLVKIRTEGDQTYSKLKSTIFQNSKKETKGQELSLTVSQDKTVVAEREGAMNNQSQYLSFSLTSVLQESTYKQPLSRRKQHAKVVSELVHHDLNDEKIKITEVQSTRNKELNYNFKKFRKQIMPRLDVTGEGKDSKPNLGINSLANLLKGPLEKKTSKSKGTKSFRRKQEEKQNISELKNGKKKSKKMINISSNQ